MKELKKIREALDGCYCQLKRDGSYDERLNEALAALSSLEAAGDGDGKFIEGWLNFESMDFDEEKKVRAALSRLVLKAKLTDEERVEIKRETLEIIQEGIENIQTEKLRGNRVVEVFRVIGILGRQLAALGKKEEGKE